MFAIYKRQNVSFPIITSTTGEETGTTSINVQYMSSSVVQQVQPVSCQPITMTASVSSPSPRLLPFSPATPALFTQQPIQPFSSPAQSPWIPSCSQPSTPNQFQHISNNVVVDNGMTDSGTVGASDQINTVTSYMIDVNLLPDQFVERFKQMEFEQQEIKNQLKRFDSAVTNYLNQLTKQIPQLIAKIETIGNANSTSSSAVPIRSKSTFQPIETEGELVELNKKAKNNGFIEQNKHELGLNMWKRHNDG